MLAADMHQNTEKGKSSCSVPTSCEAAAPQAICTKPAQPAAAPVRRASTLIAPAAPSSTPVPKICSMPAVAGLIGALIEQLAAARAIPKLSVIRPADAEETREAWLAALSGDAGPTAILLTRQDVPVLERGTGGALGLHRGAYVLWDPKRALDVILMASGSEVHIALDAAKELESAGIGARVVSFPSWDLFEKQPESYRQGVLPAAVSRRVVIEAGLSMGWERHAGDGALYITLEHFGGGTFLVRSVPSLLVDVHWESFLRELIPVLEEQDAVKGGQVVDKLLALMACHGAIRAGQRLSKEEMVSLVAQLDEAEVPTNCPHGRPVLKRLTFYEIEKMFRRIV